ncbi:MAG: AMP-binding protein [Gaiellaceae bacterium]
MKKLRIGRRRTQVATSSPLELALAPALENGSWRVPDRFNLTRDLVEVLGRDPKRPALTILGVDGIVEPRTFKQLADGATRWAAILRGKGVEPGDRVVVLSRLNEDWVDIALGCIKVGAVFAPAPPTISSQALESRVAHTEAALVVAGEESEDAIARMSFAPEVHHVRSGRMRRSSDTPDDEPTADTSSRDVAYLTWTAGTEGAPKPVAHTHGSLFAARVGAEYWLQAGTGDLVWCAVGPGSALALSTALAGPWARGAEVVIHEGDFDPAERLDLIRRVGPSVLCQTPAEYRALTELRQLARSRPPRLRRLLTTGDYLEPEVLEVFEGQWELPIHVGYGEVETGIVTMTSPGEEGGERLSGEIGTALPGHHLAVVDEQGNELPPGVEGDLAVRGRPPTLFVGYWESPDETKRAFRGDWYLTGDVAVADQSGALRYLARSGELITSRGRTFGPHDVERAITSHDAVATSAVVGVRDLERGGQFLRAFVVLEAGIDGTEQLEAELRQFVGQSLAEQQVPREIEFVDGLPRSASGAVRRQELRDRPVSGRPLWEAPPTSEPEPEPPTTAELLVPADAFVIDPEPIVEPELPVAFVQPEPLEDLAPLPEPAVPPEPFSDPELAVAIVEPDALGELIPPLDRPRPPEPMAEPEPHVALIEQEDAEPIALAADGPLDSTLEGTVDTTLEGTVDVPAPSQLVEPEQGETSSTLEPEPPPFDQSVETPAPPAELEPPVDPSPEPSIDVAAEAAPPIEEPVERPEALTDQTAEAALEPPPETTPKPALDSIPGPEISEPELAYEPEPIAWQSVEHVEQPPSQAPSADAAEQAPRHLPEFPEAVELVEPAPSSLVPPEPEPEPPRPAADVEPTLEAPLLEAEPAPKPASEQADTGVVQEVEPDAPSTAEPEQLPDYIVSPKEAIAHAVPAPTEVTPEPEPETEPEPEDLGPLPEYIVDPTRRLEVVSETPAPETTPAPEPVVDSTLEGHPLAGLARPQVSIPIPDDTEPAKKAGRRTHRRARPTPEPDSRRKRGRSTGEPGDEGLETGWMQRLSSRLDAYGIAEQGEGDRPEGDDAPGDAQDTPKTR